MFFSSIKWNLVFCVGIILIGVISIISVISYTLGINGMKEIQIELINQKLDSDINAANHYIKNYFGTINYQNNQLLDEQGQKIGENHDFVDFLQDETGDVATIFIKDGNDFKRITTNIKKENGERAVGTFLGKDSAAYDKVVSGKMYLGKAEILEKPYLTAYSPIISKGQVIGILFLGISQEKTNEMILQSSKALLLKIIIISLIALSISILVMFFISKNIGDSIGNIAQLLDQISSYELNVNMGILNRSMKRKDELGLISHSTEKMINNIKRLIIEIEKRSKKINATSDLLLEISHKQLKISEDISFKAEHTDNNTQNASASLEEITSGVQEVASSAQIVSKTAQDLTEQNERTQEKANEGEKLINQVVTYVEKTTEQTIYTVKQVTALANETKEVEDILQTISSIAEQTNLLALNAAIEAARAGEAGKGFAVVADEIRKLAEESKTSANNISSIIRKILDSAKATEQASSSTVSIVNETNELAKTVKDQFSEILNKVDETTRLVESLTATSEEQGAAAEEIATSMDSITKSVVEISEDTQGVSKGVNDQQKGVNELNIHAEELERMALELNKEIGKFIL